MKEVPPVHQANVPNEIPLVAELPLAARDLEHRLHDRAAAMSPRATTTRSGTAAPIWCRASAIAARAIRRAAGPFRRRRSTTSRPAYLSGALLDAWSAPDLRGDVRTGLGSGRRPISRVSEDRPQPRRGGLRLDDRCRQQQHALSSDDDVNAIAAYLKSLPATATQQPFAYDDATTAALRCGHRIAARRGHLPRRLRELPRHRRQGPHPIHAAARRQSDRARQRSVLAHQCRAEQLDAARRQRRARRLSHAAIPHQLTDQQIADVVTFIRNGWGNAAPPVTAAEVAKLRRSTDPTSDQVIILKMR